MSEYQQTMLEALTARAHPLSGHPRIWRKIKWEGRCLIWTGTVNYGGYGQVSIDGRKRLLHRLSWETARGPIPDGLWVLHKCDNRRCVRMSHLFLGTHADNMADCVRKGRQRKGTVIECAKLDDDKVRQIRDLYSRGGISHAKLGLAYGVDAKAIANAVNRRTWKHVV